MLALRGGATPHPPTPRGTPGSPPRAVEFKLRYIDDYTIDTLYNTVSVTVTLMVLSQ
jgi:hypothetical protein